MKLIFTQANDSDLPELVKMLADDILGSEREEYSKPILQSYIDIFDVIKKDVNNQLIIVRQENKTQIIAMLQITYIPYLTYKGSWRCLIEGVRVDKDYRNKGIGEKVFKWAIEQARSKPCVMIQLTSDKKRQEAIRFYKKLGFVDSHEGFKMWF